MARAQIGKTNWRKIIRRGLATTRQQMELISQLRAQIQFLVPPDEDNGEGYRFIFQLMAYLDNFAEVTASHQDIYLELWEIGDGKPLDLKDLNNDK